MDTHKNAPLTPKGREAMVRSVVESGLSRAAAARQFNTTPKTVAKWVTRFRAEGVDGLRDRSSRPHSLPSLTPSATCAAVEALRRQRYTGRPVSANGLTLALTTPQTNAPKNCPDGFIATTGIAPMAVSDQNHPSVGSAWPGTTS